MNISVATKDFIRCHLSDDVRALALSHAGRHGDIDLPFALDQIAGWQTARKKLPSWAATECIVYPPHINMEQCSSEATATYKAKVLGGLASGETTLVDLTGGFGVDFSFMSRQFSHAVYVERNERLCAIAQHNFQALMLSNTVVVNSDAESFLKQLRSHKHKTSTHKPQISIFADPSRRDPNGRKVFRIEECEPDVLSMKDSMMETAENVMIKLSPMLDWHDAAEKLGWQGTEVHIVSVDGECKELLLLLTHTDKPLRLVCVNGNERFECFPMTGCSPRLANGVEAKYVYVPNASVMKGGAFAQITEKHPVAMADNNSHLFLSNEYIDDFPGRKFAVHATTTLNKTSLKAALKGIDRANVSVFNFPMTAETLRKRLRLKDGGDWHLLATTIMDKHVIYVARRASLAI